jgi:tripartite-type tricarboxylate transporter receptor subunit TctC
MLRGQAVIHGTTTLVVAATREVYRLDWIAKGLDSIAKDLHMPRVLALVLAFLVVAPFGAARADYPDRPVRIIVPVAAGGGVDVMARLIAQKLSERFSQSFFVENRPGAAGIIGSKAVIAAPADGATLLYTPSSLSLTVAVNKTPPYDVAKDLSPIINVAISPYALVVNAAVPAKNLAELVAYAKANPQKLSFSSAGVGSASHLAAELLKMRTGIEMVHVPNKGMAPALVDLMGGQVQVMLASVPGMLAEKSDRVRPIAMAERKRSALMPDLPTLDEQGLKGFEVANWAGLLGPTGLDPAIVKKLHDAIVTLLDSADMKERIKALGFDMIVSTPQELGAQMTNDVVRWSDVVKRANIPMN